MKIIALLFTLISGSLMAQNTWSPIASYAAGERERAVAFSVGERGYICTGLDSAGSCKKDLWEYDPGSNSWTQKADFPGPARRDAIGFSIGNKGYVGTGITHAISYLGVKKKDFWEYNPITNSWDQKADWPGNFGQGIYFASSFVINNKGYLVCGKIGFSWYSNELWEYDPATDDWDEKDGFPGGVRYAGVAVGIGGLGYYGCGSNEDYYLRDWWAYDPQTDDWTEKADFIGSPRFNPVGFSLDGRGFVCLGTDGGCQKDLYEYNPLTNSWVQKADYGGSERRSAVAFTIGKFAYVGTGDGPTGIKRSIYKYKPFFWFDNDADQHRVASSVFPTAISNSATIKINYQGLPSEGSVRILNMNGQIIRENELTDVSTFQIEKGSLDAGIYLYEIQFLTSSGEIITSSGKFIIV